MRALSTRLGQIATTARRPPSLLHAILAVVALAVSLVALGCAGRGPGGPARLAQGEPLDHPRQHGAHDLERAGRRAHGQPDQGRVREPPGPSDTLRVQDLVVWRVRHGRRARDRGAAPDQGHPRARDSRHAGRRVRFHVRVHLCPGPEALRGAHQQLAVPRGLADGPRHHSRPPRSIAPPGSAWSTSTSGRPACRKPGSPT